MPKRMTASVDRTPSFAPWVQVPSPARGEGQGEGAYGTSTAAMALTPTLSHYAGEGEECRASLFLQLSRREPLAQPLHDHFHRPISSSLTLVRFERVAEVISIDMGDLLV